jgi:glycosyltransferase involved in cell wall biosynthesis
MFSVVIPLYNKAHTIKVTLNTVLSQSYGDFELIVVNDGSTDGGETIVAEFRDPRIRLINQLNQGVSIARNNGILASNRPYIALLDGDDEWLPNYLDTMRAAIKKFPDAGLLGCTSFHRNLATGEMDDATLDRYRGRTQIVDYFENPHVMPHTSAMVLRRDVYLQTFPDGQGFPSGMKLCEDWSCFYRMAFNAPFVYVGEPLAIRNNNVEGQITAATGEDRRRLFPYIVDFLNLTYAAAPKPIPSSFEVFLKYDIRHRFLNLIRMADWELMEYFVTHLNRAVRSELCWFEFVLYKCRPLGRLSIFFIYITKIRWRMRGYPVAGSKR